MEDDDNQLFIENKDVIHISAYYTLDIKATDMRFGLSVFNIYNRRNMWYKQYNFQVSPFQVTDVRYMGIAPNLSVEIDF